MNKLAEILRKKTLDDGGDTPELSWNGVELFIEKELSIERIAPVISGYETEPENEQLKILSSFLSDNRQSIVQKIENNFCVNKSIEDLSKVYDDVEAIENTKSIIIQFVFYIIEEFIKNEAIYIFHIKNMGSVEHKKEIYGNNLVYNIENQSFNFQESRIELLILHLSTIILEFSTLLRIKNSQWLEEYFALSRENLKKQVSMNDNLSGSIKVRRSSNTVGRKCKFSSEANLHESIRSIKNWKSISKTQIAKELGYKSSSGLNELLKSKGWSFPH